MSNWHIMTFLTCLQTSVSCTVCMHITCTDIFDYYVEFYLDTYLDVCTYVCILHPCIKVSVNVEMKRELYDWISD